MKADDFCATFNGQFSQRLDSRKVELFIVVAVFELSCGDSNFTHSVNPLSGAFGLLPTKSVAELNRLFSLDAVGSTLAPLKTDDQTVRMNFRSPGLLGGEH